MEGPPHVAVLPSPGMGHLIPIAQFAKHLVNHHHVSVTIIVPNMGEAPKAQTALLESLPKTSINYVYLPPVSFEDLPKDSKIEITIFLAVTRSLSFIRSTLRSLVAKANLVALVVDPFGTEAIPVAKEFNILAYLFFSSNAMNFAFSLLFPKLDETVKGEFRDMPEPFQIPGCVPLYGRDFMDPVQDRTNEVYNMILHHTKQFRLADGVLLNSFKELEGGAISALQIKEPGKPAVYPIGPLIRDGSSDSINPSECLKWLDNQSHGSVLFVSFGSGGTLSYDQLQELALGLEMSGQHFLWVAKSPSDGTPNAAYFSVHNKIDPLNFLPEGFLARTKERGLVINSWAPQVAILAHSSTGGFLTHGGWNSILESIVHGVPLIVWPLFAEQKLNAVLLSEGLNIALRPKVSSENGLVKSAEIEKVVKSLMDGKDGTKIRSRMNELKVVANETLTEGGSSAKSLSELVTMWKNKNIT